VYSPGCDAAVGAGVDRAEYRIPDCSYGLLSWPWWGTYPDSAGLLFCWCRSGRMPVGNRAVHYVSAADSAPFRGGSMV